MDEHREEQPSAALSAEEASEVAGSMAGAPKVVHEIVRLRGNEELDRPAVSLAFSGFAAGLAVSVSVLAEAFIALHLPDAPWAKLVIALGYSVGFVIAVLGGLQLFTETTVTAVLPVATHPTVRNLWRLLRLWTIVFLANLAGTFLVAFLMARQIILTPEQLSSAIAVSSSSIGGGDIWNTLRMAMPAGFLLASIAWLKASAPGSEFWVVLLITWVIAIGGFSHVVAGSNEAWLLMLTGRIDAGAAIGGFILPALAGNIIGGTGLFAVVAHGQVRSEIKGQG